MLCILDANGLAKRDGKERHLVAGEKGRISGREVELEEPFFGTIQVMASSRHIE